MLKTLKLRNFQRHKSKTFEFAPVTVFVGSNGQGKSSCLRSLYWLCLNRPNGDAFIRFGAKGCRVEAEVDEHNVVRSKGKRNTYRLDEAEFLAIGMDVPPPIQQLLALDDTNFQGQHDPPFWFLKTPGETSKELNAVINLELIDKTLANVATELRQATSRKKVTEERLEQVTKDAEQLAWVEQATKDFAKLEQLHQEQEKQQQRRSSLQTLLNALVAASEAIGTLPPPTALDALGAAFTAQQMAYARCARLAGLVGELETLEEVLCQTKNQLAQLEEKKQKGLKKGIVCPACGNPVSPT